MTVLALQDLNLVEAYNQQTQVVVNFHRAFQNHGSWSLPVLFVTNRNLRDLAIRADYSLRSRNEKPNKLEDSARILNRSFTLCITDRNPLEQSRKLGTLYIINLLFKAYFKVRGPTSFPK